jgi:hypothetical protein
VAEWVAAVAAILAALVAAVALAVALRAKEIAESANGIAETGNDLAQAANDTAGAALTEAEKANEIAERANQLSGGANTIAERALRVAQDDVPYNWVLEVDDDGVAAVLNDCGHRALQTTVVLDSGGHIVAETGPRRRSPVRENHARRERRDRTALRKCAQQSPCVRPQRGWFDLRRSQRRRGLRHLPGTLALAHRTRDPSHRRSRGHTVASDDGRRDPTAR